MTKLTKTKSNVSKKINYFDSSNSFINNIWVCLLILFIFWIIFFNKLLTGAAYIFDDFLHQYWPGKFMSAVSLSNGIIPFWNPYTFCGVPFVADIQIAVFYPFNLLLTLFVSNQYLSALPVQITIIFHYLLCSIFCFFLGRYFKWNNLTSILFAIMFTYCGYMIAHMIHMPNVEAVSWFSLMFLLFLRFIDTKKYYNVWIATFITALCILCGYPQVIFLNLLFIGVYAAILFVKYILSKDYYSIKHLILGSIIFFIIPFGITAFQLLPTFEFISLSNRDKFDYNFAREGSMHWYDVITFFVPKFFGVWNWSEIPGDVKYWSNHQEGRWMFSTVNLFISTLVVILIVPSIRLLIKDKSKKLFTWFLIGFSIFAFFFALGGNFFLQELMFYTVPMFNRYRNPSHITYLLSFALAIVIGMGLDSLLKDRKLLTKYLKPSYLISAISIFLFFLFLFLIGAFRIKQDQVLPDMINNLKEINNWIRNQYLVFFIFVSLFALSFYLFIKEKINFNTFAVSLIVILSIEIYVIWFTQNNGTQNPEKVFAQNSQLINEMKDKLKSEIFRVNMRYGGNMLFQRNQGQVDRIPLIEGYSALYIKKYMPPQKTETDNSQLLGLLNVKYKINIDSLTGRLKQNDKQLVENPSYLPKAVMYYDAKYFDNDSDIVRFMKSPEYDYRKTIVLEKKPTYAVLPENPDTLIKAEVKTLKYDLNEMTFSVNTLENGYLLVGEVFYPAWKAYVNGIPVEILRADYCLRAVYLEKGSHTVEFKYESDTFAKGLKISTASLGIALIGLVSSIYLLRRGRKVK